MFELHDWLDALDGGLFEERPVDVETFVTGEDYMNMKPLSENQYKLVKASTQIFNLDTLIMLYGEEGGKQRWAETFNEVIFVLGKGCHAPYTPIFDPSSGQWVRLDSITQDSRVVSSDGKSHYSTEAYQEGYGEMVRVRTALGFVEDVYVGHKYLSYKKSRFYHRYRGYSPEFTEVSNLNVGDRIAVGLGFDVDEPVNIPKEHAELIGYWLGGGCMPTDKYPTINMDFNRDEAESIARYEELCDFIGDRPYRIEHPTKNMTIFRHGKTSKAVALAQEYQLWYGRAKTKSIPNAVHASSNEILAATISRLWQADGCVYDKNGGTAEFVSVSEQLATDVHRALLRLGVPSSIRSRVPKSNHDNASEAWYVTVSSQESFNAFINAVELLDHKRRAPLAKFGRVYSRGTDNTYMDRIVSIEPIGEGPFWTLSVPDTENYLGNGMISANSGKDHCSAVACAYIVYQLLCMHHPASYYGMTEGDSIDILNIAINAQQANNVFFKKFRQFIQRAPWFEGRFDDGKQGQITFDKNITVYSGHSEREAWEGYNLIFVVLDEISGFAEESPSGLETAKTAEAVYKMYSASVSSRFPEHGKVVLLSWPRYKGDFISKRYDKVVLEKNVNVYSHTFKLNRELPDGNPENEFEIEWEEDDILSYAEPRVFALKRPSWKVHPMRKIDDYTKDFFNDPLDALGRFACQPPDAVAGFFRDFEKIDAAFSLRNGATDGPELAILPQEDKEYFIHVDLAKKHDRCAVALSHVERWETREFAGVTSEASPVVIVDAVKYWTPTKEKTIDFAEVREYIVGIRRKGFNIRKVTFDRWRSDDMIDYLRSIGLSSDLLSVDIKHYTDLAMLVTERRVFGPDEDILRRELKQLRIMNNGRIDHPRTGSKDLADATCGSVYNAITYSHRDADATVEVHTLQDVREAARREQAEEAAEKAASTVIVAPKRAMPQEVEDWISGWSAL